MNAWGGGCYLGLYIYYTLSLRSLGSKIFYVFYESLFCSSRLYLFDQKYRKKCNIVKSFCNF